MEKNVSDNDSKIQTLNQIVRNRDQRILLLKNSVAQKSKLIGQGSLFAKLKAKKSY